MEKLQVIQAKLLNDVKNIDGGWKTLSEKTGLTSVFLQRVLNVERKSKPRLATLEKVKKGILECQHDQKLREEELLA